jgi:hypothetical protein
MLGEALPDLAGVRPPDIPLTTLAISAIVLLSN